MQTCNPKSLLLFFILHIFYNTEKMLLHKSMHHFNRTVLSNDLHKNVKYSPVSDTICVIAVMEALCNLRNNADTSLFCCQFIFFAVCKLVSGKT